jgi:hypothetical protein
MDVSKLSEFSLGGDICSDCKNYEWCADGFTCEDFTKFVYSGVIVNKNRKPRRRLYFENFPGEIDKRLKLMEVR